MQKSLSIAISVEGCDHCGRGPEDVRHWRIDEEEIAILERAAPGYMSLNDVSLEEIPAKVQLILDRMLAEPLAFMGETRTYRGSWAYFGVVFDVLTGVVHETKGKRGTLRLVEIGV